MMATARERRRRGRESATHPRDREVDSMTVNGPVAIILAAGQGKRMKSEKAKVLHEVCGRPMIRYVVEAARGAGARTIVVVVGYAADQVRRAPARTSPTSVFATQTEQLGTGDAVKICQPLLEGYRGPGHGPGRRRAAAPPRAPGRPAGTPGARGGRLPAGTAIVPDPMGFGRILRDSAGRFLRIVEERDCTPEEKAIREVNPSCYVFELPGLWDALDQIGTSNAQGEYYLTDAPERLHGHGPQGHGAARARGPTTSSASTPASTSPRPRASCRRGSRTTG